MEKLLQALLGATGVAAIVWLAVSVGSCMNEMGEYRDARHDCMRQCILKGGTYVGNGPKLGCMCKPGGVVPVRVEEL